MISIFYEQFYDFFRWVLSRKTLWPGSLLFIKDITVRSPVLSYTTNTSEEGQEISLTLKCQSVEGIRKYLYVYGVCHICVLGSRHTLWLIYNVHTSGVSLCGHHIMSHFRLLYLTCHGHHLFVKYLTWCRMLWQSWECFRISYVTHSIVMGTVPGGLEVTGWRWPSVNVHVEWCTTKLVDSAGRARSHRMEMTFSECPYLMAHYQTWPQCQDT